MTSAGLLILASGFVLMALAGGPEVNRRIRRTFYGWFMAGLGALLMALGSAPLFYGLPVWNPVLRNTFGWSATQISGAFAVIQVEGFYAPLVGLLIDKLGPRRMVLIGLVIMGAGFVLFSQIRELWQLYVVFFIMSFGTNVSTWLPMMTVVNHWFTRRKARAMSLVMEGFALGGVVAPILLAWAIGGIDPEVSERYGWRNTALFLGILAIALAFPLSSLVRNRPEDLGLRPDGDSSRPVPVSPAAGSSILLQRDEDGYTWREAMRSSSFWLISLAQAVTSLVLATMLVHLGLLLDDRGFSLQTISAVVAIYPGVAAVAILIGGGFGDRFPMKLVAFGFNVLQSAAVVVLVLAHSTETLVLFAVMLGVAIGGRSSVSTALRGVYFGRKAFAAITGMSVMPSAVTWFVAPVYAGFMRDATGSYDVAFLTIAAVSLFGSFLYLLLGDPPGLPTQRTRSSQPAH